MPGRRARVTPSRSSSAAPHAERSIAVHLFVRGQKKRSGGGSAPFVYCGDVDFETWEGDRPITVQWRLREAVPERLWSALGVPTEGTGR